MPGPECCKHLYLCVPAAYIATGHTSCLFLLARRSHLTLAPGASLCVSAASPADPLTSCAAPTIGSPHTVLQGLFGAVLSDMCHSTTGFSAMDATRSLQLATCAAELAVGPLHGKGSEQQVLEVAQKGLLQPGGNLLIKLLQVREPCMP